MKCADLSSFLKDVLESCHPNLLLFRRLCGELVDIGRSFDNESVFVGTLFPVDEIEIDHLFEFACSFSIRRLANNKEIIK